MHTVSRVVVRAICNGLSQQTGAVEPSSGELLEQRQARLIRLLSTAIRECGREGGSKRFRWARCGFAKDLVGGPSTVLDKDAYGDDACFVAHHESGDVVGVADGVGGWRSYGIDPSKFSQSLMRGCAELVRSGQFQPSLPSQLLANAYHKMRVDTARLGADGVPVGSSTACVVVLDPHRSLIYTANLGDSGFLLLRQGKVVHRSHEQCHYFNTPYQISIPPSEAYPCIRDSPDVAEQTSFPVKEGDFLVVATDGLFDNLPIEFIEEQISSIQGWMSRSVFEEPSELELQGAVNSIALQARRLAFDETYMSPFAKKACEVGYREMRGGKPDDVTVILAVVHSQLAATDSLKTTTADIDDQERPASKLSLNSLAASLPPFHSALPTFTLHDNTALLPA